MKAWRQFQSNMLMLVMVVMIMSMAYVWTPARFIGNHHITPLYLDDHIVTVYEPTSMNNTRTRPMVFDMFVFGQRETVVAKIHIQTLCAVVDFFIIAEAGYTCRHEPKPYFLLDVLEELHSMCPDKIHYIKVDKSSESLTGGGACSQLEFQVQHLVYKYKELGGKDDDIVSLGEHDEIAFPRLITSLKQTGFPHGNGVYRTITKWFYYYHANCLSGISWDLGPLIMNGAQLFRKDIPAARLRTSQREDKHLTIGEFRDQSWHLSTFMTPRDVIVKNQIAAHPECNRYPFNTEDFQINAQIKCIQFCGGEQLKPVLPVSYDSLPMAMRAYASSSSSSSSGVDEFHPYSSNTSRCQQQDFCQSV